MNLRPMTMDDASFMLTLKNYPETRQFAIASHEEIKREDHLKWLEDNLQYFQIIEDTVNNISKQPRTSVVSCGAIRIQDEEISIWIDKQFWKLGIATYILQHISKRGMIAKIVEGNIASMRCFIRAGFEPTEYIKGGRIGNMTTYIIVDDYYIFKKY